jgi:hypothetical protein
MEDLGDLLRLRLDIEQYQGFLTNNEQAAAKQAQGRYQRARDAIAYGLIRHHPDPDAAITAMRGQMAMERPGTPDHLLWLMDEVEEDLALRVSKLGAQAPWIRTLIHRGPWIALALVAILYVGAHFYFLLPLDAPITTRAGIEQRAAALQKVVRHAGINDVRRHRLIVELLSWPIQPTEKETKAAGDFAGLVFGARDALARAHLICNAPPATNEVTDPDLAFVTSIASEIRAPGTTWATPPAMTLIGPIRKAYPCP